MTTPPYRLEISEAGKPNALLVSYTWDRPFLPIGKGDVLTVTVAQKAWRLRVVAVEHLFVATDEVMHNEATAHSVRLVTEPA